MNVIENGVSEVVSIEKVILDDEMYFKIKIIDYYGGERVLKRMSIKNIEKDTWFE